MNKIITFLILLLVFTTGTSLSYAEVLQSATTSVQVQQGYVFASTLRYGMTNGEVYQLQQYLINNGYLQGSVDGKFGKLTHNAVVRLQLANNLKADGIVGKGTRAILNSNVVVNNNTPTVISPNGGESWIINSVHTITWNTNTTNSDANVDIYLERPSTGCLALPSSIPCLPSSGVTFILDKNVSSHMFYNWIAGTDINNQSIPLGNYQMKICIGGTNNCDYSNNTFTLVGIPTI